MNGIDMFSQSTHSFTASAVVPYEFEIICSILPNDPPQFSNEAPSDGADEQSISLSALSIYIQDSEDDDFDWSIETSPDVGSNSGTGASDGFKTCSISGLSYSTTYNWYVNATDPLGSNTYTREVYTFTTEDEQINQAPTPPNSPSPSDDTTNVGINPTISVYVQDPDEDQMTVRFYNQEDDLIGTDTNEPSGTRAGVPWTGLEYNTDYYWYAVADDGEYTTKGPVSGYWHFKTRQEPQENEPPELPTNPLPEDDATDVDTSPSLSVFVDDPNNDVLTVVFYNASDDSIIGTDEDVPSGSTAEITWQDLGYNITYSWYAISNDDEHDVQSETWQFTTETKQNQPPTINLLKPEEGAIYFSNLRIINFPTTVIIGKIDIQATATDDVEVQKIELLIDGEKIEEQNSDVFESVSYTHLRAHET